MTAALLALAVTPAFAGVETKELVLEDGTDLAVKIYRAKGKAMIVWLPTEAGEQPAELRLAAATARQGIEVWLADPLAARFLPPVPSSLNEIPPTDVAMLFRAAADTGKTVYFVGAGRVAGLLLRAAGIVQQGRLAERLGGAVLLNPYLHAKTPEPGEDIAYLPVARNTRLSIAILQTELSPWRWQIEQLQAELERGGSDVTVRLLPKLRGRFYFRPDATPEEEAMAAQLPQLLREAIAELEKGKHK